MYFNLAFYIFRFVVVYAQTTLSFPFTIETQKRIFKYNKCNLDEKMAATAATIKKTYFTLEMAKQIHEQHKHETWKRAKEQHNNSNENGVTTQSIATTTYTITTQKHTYRIHKRTEPAKIQTQKCKTKNQESHFNTILKSARKKHLILALQNSDF